jgi:O-antigen/teichoic acid export membrane protein
MLSKNLLMKIEFKELIKNSTILSLPGFISIIISLIAIPVHLNFAGPQGYGNYIIFHFILMISVNLNFGIGKSTAISINNYPKYKKIISFKSIVYTKNISIFIFLAALLSNILNNLFFKNINIDIDFLIYLIAGSIITVNYLTFEGIFQGWKKFKYVSMFNLFFHSISFSFPSILLAFYKELKLNDLIFISVLIKLISVLLMFLILTTNGYVKKSENKILLYNLKKNSKWITLNGLLNQLYDLFDKYLIKIFLGPIALSTYSIPQQITGKLSIISKSFSAYLLPNLSQKKINNYNFNFSLNFFVSIISLLVLLLIPIYPIILQIWLGQSYSEEILALTKIFSLVVVFSCASHILITKFEANKILSKNLKIETFFMPFFLFYLYYLTSNNFSLTSISILILFKELILLLIRFYIFRREIKQVKKFCIISIINIIILWLSFFNDYLFYSALMFLIIIVFKK